MNPILENAENKEFFNALNEFLKDWEFEDLGVHVTVKAKNSEFRETIKIVLDGEGVLHDEFNQDRESINPFKGVKKGN